MSSPNVMASKDPSSQQLTTYRGGLSRKKSEKKIAMVQVPEGQSQNDVCRSHPTYAEMNNKTDMA